MIGLSSDGTGGAGVLRHGSREASRYVFVASVDWMAAWIAAATPVLATLIVLSVL
ncbi:hypothetical protein [Methylobacterium sp. Leaf399]|uniref:hypothetical protein n=1 Tax=Methylobacterium sp. Leaf399 TaxID=1736364 RepID=UPI000A69F3CF|nr:hypothetical protein [Methylobacterium sp. Leaf399]